MTPVKQLEAWRAELAAEKTDLEKDLAAANLELQAAQSRSAEARAQWAELWDLACAGLGWREDMAGGLHGRLQAARRAALEQASMGPSALRVKYLRESIAGRELGIRQIDGALSSAKVTQLPAPSVAAPRKRAPVEFDNIQMPPGQAAP